MEQPEILSIKIDHHKPLELKQFTAAMLSVESQYKKFGNYIDNLTKVESVEVYSING